ncbi:hypothetical protein F7725_000577 [Dissostichus mawsoni]|uniref:Uncharacterized protein n=1 Tax=Dissostichus mawsoni TaxID=36200 RepID=A0A7J5ZES3_DISMA|nr:hypothetical protein F7725_000577 [Dissostichus mawsoni]
MWSPDVCVCEWGGGHSSGQHQLSECEVQPQAKASLACGDKPDPPYPPTPPPHTHRAITSPHSHLPSTFKEFTPKQNALLGLPLALGWAPAPQGSVFTENYRGKRQKTVVWVGVGEDLAQKQTSLCCCSTTWAESLGTPSDATLPAWHSAAASGLNTTSLNPPPGRPGLPEPEAAYRCALVHLHASINYCSNFFLLIIIDK